MFFSYQEWETQMEHNGCSYRNNLSLWHFNDNKDKTIADVLREQSRANTERVDYSDISFFNYTEPQISHGAFSFNKIKICITLSFVQVDKAEVWGVCEDMNKVAELQPNAPIPTPLSAAGINMQTERFLRNVSVCVHNSWLHNYPLCIEWNRMLSQCYCVSYSYKGMKSAGPDKSAGCTVHSQISHEVTQLLDIKSLR